MFYADLTHFAIIIIFDFFLNGELLHCLFTADSEKFHEMEAATELPPQQCFLLYDDGEFPPMTSGRRS